MAVMDEIRRATDGELCGHIREADDGWLALSVFGGLLERYPTREEAARAVLGGGLAALAEHWLLSGPEDVEEQVVCIQDARPGSVTVALGYYSLPGVPTRTLSRADLDAGQWRLRLDRGT
jgi:hypothetical protein